MYQDICSLKKWAVNYINPVFPLFFYWNETGSEKQPSTPKEMTKNILYVSKPAYLFILCSFMKQ